MKHIGERCLSKRHHYWCRLYLVRAYHRGPGRPRKRKSYGNKDGLYRRLHRAPWLLATSLAHSRGAGGRIVRAYERRMQIEEAFRDLKNHRWGFGLRYARSANPERLQVLLLIGLLASIVLWLLGLAGKARGVQRHFQANTEAKRNVLSIPFLGQQLLRCRRFRISLDELRAAFTQLEYLARSQGDIA